MSGYTPVFNSVLDGTLYGRWPHTGVWLCLLSQCNSKGEIDAVPALLAAKIGIPLEALLECIRDFMNPDPGSRCGDEEGRRLVPVDTSREWGWRVVNCAKYRRRASGADQIEDGRNAEKVRRYKERKKSADTAGHLKTRKTPTHTHTQTHTQTKTEDLPLPPPGLDSDAFQKWVEYRKKRKPPIKAFSLYAAMCEMAKLGEGQMAAVDFSIANGYQGLVEPKSTGPPSSATPRKTKFAQAMEALDRA